MAEDTPTSLSELEAGIFINATYRVSQHWINQEVSMRKSQYKDQNPQDFVGEMIEAVHNAAMTQAESLQKLPQRHIDFHIPSYFRVIKQIETDLGLEDEQLTLGKELDILSLAETSILNVTKREFAYVQGRLVQTADPKARALAEKRASVHGRERISREHRIDTLLRFKALLV